MGSQSDYKVMKLATKILKNIGVKFETKIISAHRTRKECMTLLILLQKIILV